MGIFLTGSSLRKNLSTIGNAVNTSHLVSSSKSVISGQSTLKKNMSSSLPSQIGADTFSSAGSDITTMEDAAYDAMSGDMSGDMSGEVTGGDGTSSGGTSSGNTSPLLEGEMTFEELIGEICNGIDLIFATKRNTVVVSDYAGIYAEAKYMRDKKSKAIDGEDINMWQIEEGTYELDVSEYGFYNTVKVHYKDGVVTESYEDLVRVFGEVVIDYHEEQLDKTSAIMKAKAYLAAHIRDFDMSIKANIIWNAEIDIGDIVTIDNPLTLRDKYRVETEKRDPEYYFVTGKSIQWEGETPITGTIEMKYGAASPEKKDVPEAGTGYANGSSSGSTGDVESAIQEVGQMASKISYSHACQTHDCVQSKQTGDCWGMSDFITCELKSRGINAKILQYGTSMAANHRSVQYQDASGNWTNFPYRSFPISSLFRDTGGASHGTQVNSTC